MKVNKPEGYERFRSVSELAEYVGVTPRTIERWWTAGKLPVPSYMDERLKLWSPSECTEILRIAQANLPSTKSERNRL